MPLSARWYASTAIVSGWLRGRFACIRSRSCTMDCESLALPGSCAFCLRDIFANNSRVPHLSRPLRKVGFHERTSIGILILDMGSQSPPPSTSLRAGSLFAKDAKRRMGHPDVLVGKTKGRSLRSRRVECGPDSGLGRATESTSGRATLFPMKGNQPRLCHCDPRGRPSCSILGGNNGHATCSARLVRR